MSRAVPAFFSLVGVLMFLGFGAALAWRVHDAMQAPDAPPRVMGDQLLGLARTGEPWIEIDAAESCEYDVIPSGASSASYRVLMASGAVRGLTEASDARGCTDAPHAIRGTIRSRVLTDLELPADAAQFFAVVTLMFAGITIGQLPPPGTSLDVETMGLMAFGGVMTLALGALLLVVLRGALRPSLTMQSPREAWAPVVRREAMLVKGVDVGNRTLAYRDPFTREGEPERIVEVVIGANEGMPWIVDQHVLVMKAEGNDALHVMRQDGGPFDLDDVELARFSR
jgi:hypothetical protein